jgi:predicted phage terminase large subunit-like protein
MELWKDRRREGAYVQMLSETCLRSFKTFCLAAFKYVYRKEFIWAEHHDLIARELMRVWLGKQQNLIINLPPRYSKTELMCLFSAWCYAHNPACEFLHLSYSVKLATKNSNKVRNLIKSEWYQDCFHVCVSPDIDSGGEWAIKGGGSFKADSAGGQVCGFGAGSTCEFDDKGRYIFSGCLLIDDPLKPADAHTIERDKVNKNWSETIKSRRNSPLSTPTIAIMQRIHEGDFTAALIDDTAERFKVLALKALRDDETALWPAKHTVEMLEEMRDSNLYVFSGQYQQEPTPSGGGIFKEGWWSYCIELPDFDEVIITGDTAQKVKEHNDFSVFQAWGRAKDKVYLIDQVRGKWEAPELQRIAVSFIRRMKAQYSVRAIYVEDKASGTGLIQSLKQMALITVKAVPRNIDKVTRAYDAAPYVQSGRVVLLEGAPYVGPFLQEATSFSHDNRHLHDDQLDPCFDGISILIGNKQSNSGILMI